MPKINPGLSYSIWLLMFAIYLTCANSLAEETAVPLMLRELRDQNGNLLPVKSEVQEILAYIEHNQNLHFDIRRYPKNRLLKNAEAGDGLVFGFTKTKSRLLIFDFSEAVFSNRVWLITRSDAGFSYHNLQDLRGKRIGIERGTSYGDEFDTQKNYLFQVEEDVSSDAIRLKKLLTGRMDVMLYGDTRTQAKDVQRYVDQLLKKYGAELAIPASVHFNVIPVPLMEDELHFAILKGKNPALIEKINMAINKGKKSGEFDRILSKRK